MGDEAEGMGRYKVKSKRIALSLKSGGTKKVSPAFPQKAAGVQGTEIAALKLAFQGSTGAFQRVLIATTPGRVRRREILYKR